MTQLNVRNALELLVVDLACQWDHIRIGDFDSRANQKRIYFTDTYKEYFVRDFNNVTISVEFQMPDLVVL